MSNSVRIACAAWALIVIGFAGDSAYAQQATFKDALLDHFVGKWVLQGTIADQPTTHDVEAYWTLGHQYLCFHEASREKNKDGSPFYEAMVYIGWNPTWNQYVCVWHDTYGGVSPISFGRATKAGNDIPFVFRDGDAAFHTTFTYVPDSDTWKWKMDNDQKGVLTPFARVSLTRVK